MPTLRQQLTETHRALQEALASTALPSPAGLRYLVLLSVQARALGEILRRLAEGRAA